MILGMARGGVRPFRRSTAGVLAFRVYGVPSEDTLIRYRQKDLLLEVKEHLLAFSVDGGHADREYAYQRVCLVLLPGRHLPVGSSIV